MAQGGRLHFKVIETIFTNTKPIECYDVKIKLKKITDKEMELVVVELRTKKIIGNLYVPLIGIDLSHGTEGWYEVKNGNKWLGQIHLKIICDEASLSLKKETERQKSVKQNRIHIKE